MQKTNLRGLQAIIDLLRPLDRGLQYSAAQNIGRFEERAHAWLEQREVEMCSWKTEQLYKCTELANERS